MPELTPPTTPSGSIEETEKTLKMLDETRLCGRGSECGEWHGLCPENVTAFVRKVKDVAYTKGRSSMRDEILAVVPKIDNGMSDWNDAEYRANYSSELLANIKDIV